MIERLLKHQDAGKASEVLDDFVSAVAAFDPDGASPAQATMIQAELATLARRLGEAEAQIRRERRATEALQATYRRYLAAAHRLEERIEPIADEDRRSEMETSLSRLIDTLERLKPELALERKRDAASELWARRLRSAYQALSAKLRHARNPADRPAGSSQPSLRPDTALSAGADRRQHQPGAANAVAACLTTALSSISVALDAMNREAARVRAENEALETKARHLRGDGLEQDPHIAAALNIRPTERRADGRDLRERLARLEDRSALPAMSAA